MRQDVQSTYHMVTRRSLHSLVIDGIHDIYIVHTRLEYVIKHLIIGFSPTFITYEVKILY